MGRAMPNVLSMPAESSGTSLIIACSSDVSGRMPSLNPATSHSPIVALHRGEQRRQPLGRVRDPVAVVAAVDAGLRSKHRQVQRDDPARAVGDGRAPARVRRTVQDHHDVCAQLVAILCDRGHETW